jgi:predicted outer membrane repeat protein
MKLSNKYRSTTLFITALFINAAQAEITALTSTCSIPEGFGLTLEERVIGDGSADSCTNDAIQEAASLGGDITFNCGSDEIVIPITSTIEVEANAIIDGEGLVTLDGQNETRILLASNYIQLELHGLTFTQGTALNVESLASGGAVRGGYGGELYIKDCTFTDNVAGEDGKEGGAAVSAPINTTLTVVSSWFEGNYSGTGPAVHVIGTELSIVDSVFYNNESTTDGGGAVYTDGATSSSTDEVGGNIYLCGSRFSNNTAVTQGGGAYLWAYYLDTVTIEQCLFEENQVTYNDADTALGGAIRIGDATLYVDQTLFLNNHSASKGGAIWVNGNYPNYITNSTFVGNNAGTEGITTGGRGGAITGDNLEMNNLTFDSNWAINGAGAIFNNGSNAVLNNSILLDNYADNSSGKVQVCKTSMDGANNMQWPEPDYDDPCTDDTTYSDPLLEDLADNGGTTQTQALGSSSPAIDLGSDCEDIDQRGEARSEPCDLGAYESNE